MTERLNFSNLEEQLNAEREEHRKTLERLAQLEVDHVTSEASRVTLENGKVSKDDSHVIELSLSKSHVTKSQADGNETQTGVAEDSLNVKYTDSLESPFVQPLPPVNHTHFTRLNSEPQSVTASTPLHSTPTKKWGGRHGNVPGTRESIRQLLAEVKNSSLSLGSKVNLDTPGGRSLSEDALMGLRQAFDLINTLTSINVQLQDEVARLTQENLVS